MLTARGIAVKICAARARQIETSKRKLRYLDVGNETKKIEDTIRRIRKAASGLRTTGKSRTNTLGRPKAQPGQNAVAQVLTGQQVDTVLQ